MTKPSELATLDPLALRSVTGGESAACKLLENSAAHYEMTGRPDMAIIPRAAGVLFGCGLPTPIGVIKD